MRNFIVFLFIFQNVLSQNKYDTFYQNISNEQNIEIKINGLCKLGLLYNDTIKSFKYLNSAMKIAQQNHIYDAVFTITAKKAYQYHKLREDIKTQKLIALILNSIDNINKTSFDAETLYLLSIIENEDNKSLKFLFKGLEISKKNSDFSLCAKLCYSISTLYSNLGEVDLMKKYVLLSEEYSKKAKTFEARIFADLTLGIYYMKLYEDKNDISYLHKTIEHYTETQKYIKNNIPKYVFTKQMPYVFINLANAYSLLGLKNHEKQFLESLERAEFYGQELNSKSTLNSAIGLRGEHYLSKKDYSKAIETFKNGLKMANQFKDNSLSVSFCESLEKCFDATNDFDNYKKYEKLKYEYSKKQFNEATAKEVILAEERFKNENKELKIITLEKENNLKTYLFWIILSMFIISVFMIILYYYYNKTKQNLSSEKQLSLELLYKVKENEVQKILFEKELTEQQKNKVQLQLVNNLMQLKDKNVLLTNLKDISESKSISKIINENLNFDDKIDFYSNQLSDENVAFFKKLQEKSNHTLTALDLKYCIYFMTGLETKEIASKLNIEPKSVRMTRYRIKKKLQLSESDDLYEYLKLTAC
jgi:DNA-binding CsgD family transcriptional regulator